MDLKKSRRSIVGVGITLLAFALASIGMSSGFGWPLAEWPSRLHTLLAILIGSWLAGVLVGERVISLRLSTFAASGMAIAILAGSFGFGIPWTVSMPPSGPVAGLENVRFLAESRFTYYGSEDNVPLDNVVLLRFPAPQIENRILLTMTTWELYYREANLLRLQISKEEGIVRLLGLREETGENIEILEYGPQSKTSYGPKIFFRIDRIYPGEVFGARTYTEAPEEDENNVTLQVYGAKKGLTAAYLFCSSFYKENKTIDLSFHTRLGKIIDNEIETLEEFIYRKDNASAAAWYFFK